MRPYFEARRDLREKERDHSQTSELPPERAIYKDIRSSGRPRHTERERADARDLRRKEREERVRRKRRNIRTVTYERPTRSETAEYDGEGWIIHAKNSVCRLNWGG